MREDNLKLQTATDANTVLAAGDLKDGEHFLKRKGGKWLTVHCHVMSKPTSEERFDRMHYIIATDGKKLQVLDYEQKVIACR